jgi:EAL domain-containing protein (putative c-di-GMP-specific phosphodiesterase class I)
LYYYLYSSLNYLKLIPASEIKIDRSFIKDIFNDENDAELVKIIIQIAKMMKMKIVAEGVETKAQAEILRILGCDYAQGFYFAKPMPFDEFIAYLKQQ